MFDPGNLNSQMSQEPSTTATKVGIEPTFFGKVMAFVALAMLASVVGVYVTNTYLSQFFIQTPALMYVLFGVELLIIFTANKWKQISPLNKILFAVFAFITGATIAPLIGVLLQSPAGVSILTKALISTVCVFVATAIFGWTTKMNLSGMRGFLTIGLIGVIVVSLIGIFLPWNNTFEIIISGFGVLLFSGFIMYEFQRLKSYPEDACIDAALSIYLSIFNLFLYILRLIMALNRN